MVKNIPKVSRMSRCLGTVAVLVLCVTLADAAAGVGSVVVNRQRDMKEIAVFARDYLASRHRRHNGNACPCRPQHRNPSTRRGSRRRMHRLGRGGASQPRRRHFRPDRTRTRRGYRGTACRFRPFKKIAAGSTHVVIDIPVGATAKVRSEAAADQLASRLSAVAARFDLALTCVQTDGSQPVGRGIGPGLEAFDVLAVLQNAPDAPDDLRRRAILLAGAALEIGGKAAKGKGEALALATLVDGRAWSKFMAICEAQGGLREPPKAAQVHPLIASRAGRVVHINNRKIARLAKLAGAPESKAAGVQMAVRLGDEIASGQPLLHVHAETAGELGYALDYAAHAGDLFEVES